ncbi:uncharacterized protein LOC106136779 [Amyelois transitella]|uniref:uncharacterized protein LOC106136779 n=1 Tax=Amyelois transitella TaxID=680683 RepID=UPI00067E4265|nr:uncharacterized protein LOC106136779 [Amyelois transitella]
MSWTNDVVLEFLELYRREQHLWDPKHPHHRNRGEVNNAWVRIQSSLSINCAITDLKKKKESLMTSFRMHFNKKKKCQEAYHTTWFAYPLMESFLSGKYECDSTNQMEHEFFNNVEVFSHPTPPLPDNTTQAMGLVDRNMGRPTKPVSSITKSTMSYAKKVDNPVATFNTGEKRDMDEYDLYGQLLAKKLRKLDEHQRDVAMHEIDNIMFRAKMQSSNTQRSYSSSPSPVPRKVRSPIFIVAQQTHQQYEDENTPFQEHMQPQPPS